MPFDCAQDWRVALRPHNHTEHFEVKARANEDFYNELDMVFLQKVADALLAIPGWATSAGARAEIESARQKRPPDLLPQIPRRFV